ncbi:maturation protein [ssRNA phage Zoerhiza.2_21]|uniref:Maturation protein n=2 Tax=Leviviricetes TaxID=2842243 RepID=A0A8S5L2W2_9VIRU|nr:maturation protein [ssRNA phage Zoerhiza.2_21]QDH89687.1 MAG: hypothetical protein H2Rhizo33531_000003 [Leviviridae sp.]DAD51756.1 TPA_asm: maturation protein [ssRNA phage Zoerhiza.2_21]
MSKFTHRARTRKRLTPVVYKQLPRYGAFYIEKTPDSGDYVKYSDGTFIDPELYSYGQLTSDESHGEAPYRTGGPFSGFKVVPAQPNGLVGVGTHYSTHANNTISGVGSGRTKYVGGHQVSMGDWPGVDFDTNWLFRYPNVMSGMTTWHDFYTPSTTGLESSAWSRTKPKLEQGGLGVAIAEARDVPHMLRTSGKGFLDIYKKLGGDTHSKFLAPKKVADHFLNHSFGWVPFVNDVNNLIDNVINGAAKLDKLIKKNGSWEHRKVTLLDSSSSEIVYQSDNGSMYYPANIMYQSMDSNPSYLIRKTTHRVAYGVGRFRYYQPYLDNQSDKADGLVGGLRRQLLLHGARLTPQTIYRATPWTWLADWISSSGSIVDTINSMMVDGMASKYFYLCDSNVTSLEVEQTHPWNDRSDAPRSLKCLRYYETKTRKEASPFGFSFAWDNLSPKQLAILAALGVSRH